MPHALVDSLVTQDGVADVLRYFSKRLRLVVMRIHVDDEKIIIATLVALEGGIAQQCGGVEFAARRVAYLWARVHSQYLILAAVQAKTKPTSSRKTTSCLRRRTAGSATCSP